MALETFILDNKISRYQRPRWPSNSIPTNILKRYEDTGPWRIEKRYQTNAHTQMLITALFTVAKWGNKHLLIDEWINKKWYSHTMQYYLSMKMNWSCDTFYNVDEPQKHEPKSKKKKAKHKSLYIILFNLFERSEINPQRHKADGGCQALGRREKWGVAT